MESVEFDWRDFYVRLDNTIGKYLSFFTGQDGYVWLYTTRESYREHANDMFEFMKANGFKSLDIDTCWEEDTGECMMGFEKIGWERKGEKS